jgi:hypothetical protein
MTYGRMYGGAAVVMAAAGYLLLRRLGERWGATDDELHRALPGDDVLANPQYQTTHAITIDAPPAAVWPWLIQMGYHRAGWYTPPPWIDRIVFGVNNPSLDRIVPGLQHMETGDIVPDGPPGTAFFRVLSAEPRRHIVLRSMRHPYTGRWPDLTSPDPGPYLDFTWTLALEARGEGGTRLLLRTRADLYGPRWLTAVLPQALLPIDFLEARWGLQGIKRRAERNFRERGTLPVIAPSARATRSPQMTSAPGTARSARSAPG